MISVIDIWIFILIIQLVVATPYRRLQIALVTAEGWNGRFDPFFLQSVFFICITKPQKKLDSFLSFLPPERAVFFCRWSLTFRSSKLRLCWQKSEIGPQRPNLTILDLFFCKKSMPRWIQGFTFFSSPHFHFLGFFFRRLQRFVKIEVVASTDAYRGSPPYTIFQIPDNKEIQYCDVLGVWRRYLQHFEKKLPLALLGLH